MRGGTGCQECVALVECTAENLVHEAQAGVLVQANTEKNIGRVHCHVDDLIQLGHLNTMWPRSCLWFQPVLAWQVYWPRPDVLEDVLITWEIAEI